MRELLSFFLIIRLQEGFAPGVEQMFELEFMATEYRYYSDTITIQCETGEKLLVPIHAYPVLRYATSAI